MVFASRPRLLASPDGSAFLTYDAYEDGRHHIEVVMTDGIDVVTCPKPLDLEGDLFAPRLCTMGDYTVIAALHQQDVISSEGVIDHHPTVLVACSEDMITWNQLDGEERGPAVDLSHGVIARPGEPDGSVLGFLGRSRHFELVKTSPEKVWLCWEAKSIHNAWARHGTGALFGRPIEKINLGPTHRLHNGFRLYAMAVAGGVTDEMIVAGRGAIEEDKMPLRIERIDVSTCSPYSLPPASRKWQPAKLPDDVDDTNRHRWQTELGGNAHKLFWGDVHAHTGASSDAEGEPDEVFHYARDKAKLDFVAFQDNDCYLLRMTGHDYNTSLMPAQYWSRDGEFVVIAGWEWTSHPDQSDPNHRTCIFPDDNPFLIHWPDIDGNTELLAHMVQQSGGLAHPHHGRWELACIERETNVEIVSGWEAHFALETEWVHQALNNGIRLGFVGGSDSHRFNPGLGGALTGIWARGLTRKEIFEALRTHKCFATTGSRIGLLSTIDDNFMGSSFETQAGTPLHFELRVQAPDIVEEVLLVGDGKDIEAFDGKKGRECSYSFEMPARKGWHWSYWKVTLKRPELEMPMNLSVCRGRYAWTSPIWAMGT